VIKHTNGKPVAPAWAMAVIRRESAFAVDAKSRVGARGLMQLMPRTARYVARTLKTRVRRADLFKANTNIRLGVTYLSMELEKFSGHAVLATAAYNAGPHRVIRWLPKNGRKPADIWVETIPFRETRNYCRAVMSYMTIYERRMGLKQTRIMDRLKPVHIGLHAKNSKVKF
jgi:soluble lytic murein transglycosylase